MQSFRVTAPTRVDLAGGTLDIWPLYCLAGGAKTINVALDMCATASFETKAQGKWEIELKVGANDPIRFTRPYTIEEAKALPDPFRFPAFVVSRYIAQHDDLAPHLLRIHLETSVPPRSGLGGSSTLCVALIRGLARLTGDYHEQGWQLRMLAWVRDAEAEFLRMLTGTQDYLAALFGGVHCFHSDTGGIDYAPYREDVLVGLEERLLVLFSGEHHHSGASNWEIIKGAMEGNDDIRRGMEAIRHVAEQLDKEFDSGTLSWKHIGACLNDEWEARKRLFRVHTKRLDEIIAFLADKDVLGAKVCGAAQGGSLLALVDPNRRASLAAECEKYGIHVLPARPTRHGVNVV